MCSMRGGKRRLLCLLLPVAAMMFMLAVQPASARGAPRMAEPFKRCPGAGSAWQCATVIVPLDWTGKRPGTVKLVVVRRTVSSTGKALLALSGGPGQGATAMRHSFYGNVKAGLKGRDLLIIDQRGTGRSQALNCPQLQATGELTARNVRACADRLGSAAGFYATADSVRDIEAVRRLTGYNTLSLYGVSYGTKVALEYARRYPQRTERLLLDSVVDRPDALRRSSLLSVPRILDELCDAGRCRQITSSPSADFATLLRRMRKDGGVRAVRYDRRGRAQKIKLTSEDMLYLLMAGDFDEALRAALPAAVAAALRGDPQPLARLERHSSSQYDLGRASEMSAGAFMATTCLDRPFPRARGDSPAQRLRKLRKLAAAMPDSAFGMWDRTTAVAVSDGPACAHWRYGARRQGARPLPDVPALIISGTQDLRTPLEDAERVAAMLPRGIMLKVAGAGHDVIDNENGECTYNAVNAFFSGEPVEPCDPPERLPLRPVDPRTVADVTPWPGIADDRVARTVAAARATMLDIAAEVSSNSSMVHAASWVSGLRGGGAEHISGRGWRYRVADYSYVSGVKLTGTVNVGNTYPRGRLKVTGTGATGWLQFTPDGVRGRLNGITLTAKPLNHTDHDRYEGVNPEDEEMKIAATWRS